GAGKPDPRVRRNEPLAFTQGEWRVTLRKNPAPRPVSRNYIGGGQLPVELDRMMAKAVSSLILQMIHRAVDDPRVRDLPAQELLRRFHTQQDQPAFHALL